MVAKALPPADAQVLGIAYLGSAVAKTNVFGPRLALQAADKAVVAIDAQRERTMLRITVQSDPPTLTFRLEGRLTGPWVQELEACWQSTAAGRPGPVIRFDLTGVTFIDAAGKAFLAARRAQGAELVVSGCWMRAVVAELANAASPDGGRPEGEGERN